MSLRDLPAITPPQALAIRADGDEKGIEFDLRPDALERWNAGVRAAADPGANVITMYEPIGEDPWTGGGVTSKRVSAQLAAIGADQPVEVLINSPGGSFFEGLTIYNLLRMHKAPVAVKVMGLAASAASVIAMAGDTIAVPQAGFLMIHNAWGVAVGNRHDLRAAAETLEPFDLAMAEIYASQGETTVAKAAKWMDAETWFNGSAAIEAGLADELLAPELVTEDPKAAAAGNAIKAVRQIDSALARQNVPRAQRRRLLASLKGGTPGAAAITPAATHDAGDPVFGEMLRTLAILKSR
jgi:ATP-dependent protease ClpP protease subunit